MVTNIEFNNVESVLNDFGKYLVEEYKEQLILNDVNASDGLYNSVRYIFNKNGGTFEVSLELAHYWKYVENGRKAGKWPPIKALYNEDGTGWIQIKPVLPRPMDNGKLPTTQQLAFLIARKIGLEGIAPRPLLQKSVDNVWDVFEEFIAEAFAKDLETEIEIILETLRG
jgi:hypothetical protein